MSCTVRSIHGQLQYHTFYRTYNALVLLQPYNTTDVVHEVFTGSHFYHEPTIWYHTSTDVMICARIDRPIHIIVVTAIEAFKKKQENRTYCPTTMFLGRPKSLIASPLHQLALEFVLSLTGSIMDSHTRWRVREGVLYDITTPAVFGVPCWHGTVS